MKNQNQIVSKENLIKMKEKVNETEETFNTKISNLKTSLTNLQVRDENGQLRQATTKEKIGSFFTESTEQRNFRQTIQEAQAKNIAALSPNSNLTTSQQEIVRLNNQILQQNKQEEE